MVEIISDKMKIVVKVPLLDEGTGCIFLVPEYLPRDIPPPLIGYVFLTSRLEKDEYVADVEVMIFDEWKKYPLLVKQVLETVKEAYEKSGKFHKVNVKLC